MKLQLIREWDDKAQANIGHLMMGDEKMYALELPWIPTDPGGKPNESCVPAGSYDLLRYQRANGDEVYALSNPGLAVYVAGYMRPKDIGRFAILIHAGNHKHDIEGCIAPGMVRTETGVGRSREAMRLIMAADLTEIEII